MKKHIQIVTETVSTKDFMKWLNALWSGEYKQTNMALQDEFGFCCLGVACDIFIPRASIAKNHPSGTMIGGLPSAQISAPEWLKKIDYDFAQINEFYSLSILNDDMAMPFSEIADALYAVYILEVLK